MNRNWYAILLVCVLGAALLGAGVYMNRSVQQLEQDLSTAYACAETGNFDAARVAFHAASRQSEDCSRIWFLLIRRSLVDQLNQTLATLPAYANPENLPDLAVEVARAKTQLRQIRQSFFSCL